jgi:hypothetical protein
MGRIQPLPSLLNLEFEGDADPGRKAAQKNIHISLIRSISHYVLILIFIPTT